MFGRTIRRTLLLSALVVPNLLMLVGMARPLLLRTTQEDPTRNAPLWLGDNWIPPSRRYYSVPELQVIYGTTKTLWLGDSTARRTFATLTAILKHKNSTSLEMHQVDAPSVLTREEAHETRHDYRRAKCLSHVLDELRNLTTGTLQEDDEYQLVIISAGTWDLSPHRRHECQRNGSRTFPQSLWHDLNLLLQQVQGLANLKPHVHIVWRNLPMNQHALEQEVWLAVNQYSREALAGTFPNILYLDVATPLQPRSVLHERIAGDNIYHFGLKGRLVTIQLLANELVQRGMNKS